MSTMDEQFTVKGIKGDTTMNRAAYEDYQKSLESRRAVGRYTLEEAAQYVADNSNASARSIFTKLEKSAETGELTIHWPGSDEVYKPKPRDPLSMLRVRGCGVRGFEEAYWSDLNAWLEKNEPRLNCEFPNPDAPAAKDEVRLSVTDQQNNTILKWLRDQKFDPLKIPVPPSGKSGVKKLCRDAVKFSSQSVFNTAWDRLRSDGAIKDEE